MDLHNESNSYYQLWKISVGAEAQDVLACALELGLFTRLADGPKTIAEIAEHMGIKLRPAEVLAVTCAAIGVLRKDGDRYANVGDMEEFLVEGQALYNQYTAFGRAGYVDPERGAKIKEAILTDRPQKGAGWLDKATGKSRPSMAFYPKRHHLRIIWGDCVARAFDFSKCRKIVDLGGATGGHLVGIAKRYPHLEAIVFDLEYNRQGAEEGLAQTDSSGKIAFQTGNFFEDTYPPSTDVFFMSHVLHDWGRDRCMCILQRCYEALPEGGVAIAAEFLLNEEKTGPLLAAFQGLHVFYNNIEAKQWTGSEIQQMMSEAGFQDMEIRPIDPEQSIVIGWKR